MDTDKRLSVLSLLLWPRKRVAACNGLHSMRTNTHTHTGTIRVHIQISIYNIHILVYTYVYVDEFMWYSWLARVCRRIRELRSDEGFKPIDPNHG